MPSLRKKFLEKRKKEKIVFVATIRVYRYTIQDCKEFKGMVQLMMNQGEIEFLEKINEESVNVITRAEFAGGSFLGGPKPLTIFFKVDPV